MKNKESQEFILYTIVSIINAAIAFLTMMILTRITSEAFFGQINLFISAANLVMSFICFGFDCAYIRFFYEVPNSKNGKQLAYICIIPSMVLFVIVGILFVILRNTDFLENYIGGKGLYYIGAFILVVCAQYFFRYLTIFFRMKSKIIWFSVVTICSTLLSKTIFIFLRLFTADFFKSVYFVSIVIFVFSVVVFFINRKSIIERTQIEFKKFRELYRFALMSAPGFAIIYLTSYIPQVIIKHNLGSDVLGIYSAALLFCSAIQILSTGFTTFWSPYMYKNYKTKSEEIKRIHDLVMVSMMVVLIGILCFHKILYLFIGEAFRKNQNLLGLLLIYPIVVIIVETTGYGINIEKKNEISLLIYFFTMLINAVLCNILSLQYGLDGVAFSSLISSIFHFIFLTYWGQKYYCSIKSKMKTIGNFSILITIAIGFYILYDYFAAFLILTLVLLILILMTNKSLILWALNILKNKVFKER